MIRIGVIGTGAISHKFLVPAISKATNVALWSVLSRDECRGKFFAKHHNALSPTPLFCDQQKFLEDPELDAVVIATPDGLHASQAIMAAMAGKHVLVEKPMANSVSDAEAMIEACDKYKVKLAVGYHMRWHQGHRKLRQKIQNNDLGAVHHIRAQWSFKASRKPDWHTDPMLGRWWSLAGVGTHLIDWAYWLLEPTCGSIRTSEGVIWRNEVTCDRDAAATVTLQFASGATAHLYSSILASGPTRAEILGTEGYAYCENTLGQSGSGTIETSDGGLLFEILDPYQLQIANFADAIMQDSDPEVSGADGLRNVELLELLSKH